MQNSKRSGMSRALCALVGATLLSSGGVEARKLYPVDEGPRDSSFLAFRNRLIAAVQRHDLRFIHRILDPQATASFGGMTFEQMYEGKHPQADLWKELSAALSLGGQFVSKDQFCAPYVYSR